MGSVSTLRRPAPSRAVLRGRGATTRVLLTTEDALAPCIEGMSLADEAGLQFQRIVNAAIANNRGAVISLAEYGQGRAARYRAELARMAGEIDPPDDEGSVA